MKEIRVLRNSEVRSEGGEGEESPMTITGYAAVFESPTMYGSWQEVIARGAFDGCDMTDVAALFNHDPSLVLSRTNGTDLGLKLSVDDKGLRYEFKALNECAERVAEDIKLGFISKSSFGFYVGKTQWDDIVVNGQSIEQRTITKIEKVVDVSPVTFPAYGETEVEARSIHERERPIEQRSIEKLNRLETKVKLLKSK